MSGVNVEFYKSQLLKHADVLDQRLLGNDYVKQIHEKTQVRPASAQRTDNLSTLLHQEVPVNDIGELRSLTLF